MIEVLHTRETTVRCDQNRIVGCGARVPITLDVYYLPGTSRLRELGMTRCTCGLPLAVARDARGVRTS